MMTKLPKTMPVETIDSKTIKTLFAAAVSANMESAALYLGTCKRFIRWCWSEELLDQLPRNIDTKEYADDLSTSAKEVEVMPIEIWRELYDASSDRTKLYMLIAANCGFSQADIADLRPTEYSKETAIITRKRTKRKHDPKAPVIEYKLWPKTKELLDNFASDGELLLVNEDGKPLINRKAGSKVDNIYVAFFACK